MLEPVELKPAKIRKQVAQCFRKYPNCPRSSLRAIVRLNLVIIKKKKLTKGEEKALDREMDALFDLNKKKEEIIEANREKTLLLQNFINFVNSVDAIGC